MSSNSGRGPDPNVGDATETSRTRRFWSDPEWGNYWRFSGDLSSVGGLWARAALGVALLSWVGRELLAAALWRVRSRLRPLLVRVGAVADGRTGAYLFGADEIPELTAFAAAHHGSDVESIRRDADAILEGSFGWPTPDALQFPGGVRWHGPFADAEQLFWLNRWYFGVVLAKAYLYTGSNRYVRCLVGLLESWVRSNPLSPASPVWESYSVGERIVNWTLVVRLLERSADFQAHGAALIREQVVVHAKHLLGHLENRYVHNHLINNARALYTYGEVFPGLPYAGRSRSIGWSLLERELRRQFKSDGMLGEQSTHYHLLLLGRYAEATLLAQANGRAVPDWWLKRLRLMFTAGNLFVRPDQSLVTIGDVSPDATPEAVTVVLAVGAARFGVPTSVRAAESVLWVIGAHGLRTSSCPEREDACADATTVLAESGYAVRRSRASHVVLRCDPLAAVVRHGHHDPLGIDVWIDGVGLVVDPGNSSFRRDAWDDYFRGPYGQSTLVVDGYPPYIRSETMRSLLPKRYWQASAALTARTDEAGMTSLSATHTGYARLLPPVVLEREIRLDSELVVTVVDHVRSTGKHFVEFLFQLGENSGVLSAGNAVDLFDRRGRRVGRLTFSIPIRIALRSAAVEPRRGGWYSPRYGVERKSTTVVCSADVDGGLRLETRIDRLVS